MSIRSGGRPRGERPPPRYEPDAYATESIPRFSEPYPRTRNGRGGRGGGSGVPGILKFLLFAAALAGFVLVVGLTALRPLVNNAVVSWAADNPGALLDPVRRGIVREDLGEDLTAPGERRRDAGDVRGRAGGHGDDDRATARARRVPA